MIPFATSCQFDKCENETSNRISDNWHLGLEGDPGAWQAADLAGEVVAHALERKLNRRLRAALRIPSSKHDD
jgi:hypothetical protein